MSEKVDFILFHRILFKCKSLKFIIANVGLLFQGFRVNSTSQDLELIILVKAKEDTLWDSWQRRKERVDLFISLTPESRSSFMIPRNVSMKPQDGQGVYFV